MPDAHKNFAYSTVATAPSPATSGTSLVVAAGDGALFPTPPFNATVWPASTQPSTTNAEIIRVTAISTDTLTIVRTQESTSARSIGTGDQIAATITAKTLTDAETGGDVTGPAGSTADHIPQFSDSTGKVLKDGLAVASAATASAVAKRDANANIFHNNSVMNYTATATSGGTTTLTVASTQIQDFTGTSTHTVVMPVVSTLTQGFSFLIKNHSTGSLNVNSSGSNSIGTISPGREATLTCISTSGTTAASWDMRLSGFEILNTIAAFLSDGTSANFRAYVSDESGTGLLLFQNGDLGTPTAGILTNATGYKPENLATGGVYFHPPTTSSTSDSTAVHIPRDNTIPQNTEGKEYLTITVSPKNASSTLVIEFTGWVGVSTVLSVTVALFKDTGADALCAVPVVLPAAAYTTSATLRFTESAASTSSRTYKIRYGTDTGTAYMLRASDTDLYSTAKQAVLSVTEILP